MQICQMINFRILVTSITLTVFFDENKNEKK